MCEHSILEHNGTFGHFLDSGYSVVVEGRFISVLPYQVTSVYIGEVLGMNELPKCRTRIFTEYMDLASCALVKPSLYTARMG